MKVRYITDDGRPNGKRIGRIVEGSAYDQATDERGRVLGVYNHEMDFTRCERTARRYEGNRLEQLIFENANQ